MNFDQFSKDGEYTLLDSIKYHVEELDDIGIGIQDIVNEAKFDFELQDKDLIEYLRNSLNALVEAGARPFAPEEDCRSQLFYGENNEEIVEGAIANWQELGRPRLVWGQFWFALPAERLERLGPPEKGKEFIDPSSVDYTDNYETREEKHRGEEKN